DNLPVALIPRFVELRQSSGEEVRRVALGLDARDRHFLDEFPRVFEELRGRGVALEVLYLDASDDVLVHRFSETRRPHPAAGCGAARRPRNSSATSSTSSTSPCRAISARGRAISPSRSAARAAAIARSCWSMS